MSSKQKFLDDNPVQMRNTIRRMSLPVILESVFSLSGNLIYLIILGRIDRYGLNSLTHISVHGLTFMMTGIVWCLLKGLSVGATILIAKAHGAQEADQICKIAKQTFILSFLIGLLCGIIFYWQSSSLMSVFEASAEQTALGSKYFQIAAFGMPLMGLMHSVTGILQGLGNTKTPMFLSAVLNLGFIAFGTPIIYGWIGQAQGVIGDAIGLVMAQCVTATIGVFIVNKTLQIFKNKKMKSGYKKLDLNLIPEIIKKGLPTSIELILWQIASLIMSKVLLTYGDVAYNAHQIGLNVESITNMPASSYSVVATTLISYSLGSQKLELAQDYLKQIKRVAAPIIVGGSILLLVFPFPLMQIMTPNMQVIALGVIYLRLMGIIQIPQNIQGIYFGAMKSMGYVSLPTIITALGIWLIRIPLTLYFSTIPEATIVWTWLAIAADQVFRFILTEFLYHRHVKRRFLLKL